MKKLLIKFLVCVFGVFGFTQAFSDVPATDADVAIFQHLADIKVMPARTDGRFAPQDSVSKSEALAFAMRAGGIAIPAEFDPAVIPADVDPNSWFAPVIARAKALRITNPDATTFGPHNPVMKAEFLAFLFRSTKVNFSSLMSKNSYVAKDIPADSWMAPHFRYAKRFDISQITLDEFFLPFKTLSRREVAVITYRQLKLFHGDEGTNKFVELQAHIRQFMQLIQNQQEAEATKHLHKILTLSRGLSLKKNDKNAVATKALSKSFKHLVSSLRSMKYGKKLQAIESLSLAENYAQKASKKSESIAPVAQQVSLMVSETLDSFVTQTFALN